VIVPSVAPQSPGPDYVWLEGSWTWRRDRWEWEESHWARAPHQGAVWMPGDYEYVNGKHYYRHGYWR